MITSWLPICAIDWFPIENFGRMGSSWPASALLLIFL